MTSTGHYVALNCIYQLYQHEFLGWDTDFFQEFLQRLEVAVFHIDNISIIRSGACSSMDPFMNALGAPVSFLPTSRSALIMFVELSSSFHSDLLDPSPGQHG